MSRATALAGVAVAAASLATSWRGERAQAGMTSVAGFGELPVLGLVVLAVGAVLIAVPRLRVTAGLAAGAFAVASLFALGGQSSSDDGYPGPAPWLFVTGCLVAAIGSLGSARRARPA